MYKVSDIISMPVISIYESELQGIVYNLMLDFKQKKCKYLCVLNENDEIQKVLNIKDIFKIGDECIFIKNNNSLELECTYPLKSHYFNPLNLQVFNMKGQQLGHCSNILLDDKLNIVSIILNNNVEITIKKVVNIGKSIILVNDSIVNISRFKPAKTTYAYNNLKDKDNRVTILTNQKITSRQHLPDLNSNKVITNGSFLLDRTITKDVIATNGEIIAKCGTKLSKEIIYRASSYGKLIELARFSQKKTNHL